MPRAVGDAYQHAAWRFHAPITVEGVRLARAAVLEGPNEFIVGEEEKFTPHGYAVLNFDGAHLEEEIRSPTGQVIYSKRLA